jgi:hypothetical protein
MNAPERFPAFRDLLVGQRRVYLLRQAFDRPADLRRGALATLRQMAQLVVR